MEKIVIEGDIAELSQPKFLTNGAEVQTVVVAYQFTNGTFSKECTVPVSFYGAKGLDKLHALNLGVGDKVRFKALLSGRKSKNGEFWNADVQGDVFDAVVLVPAKQNTADIDF